MIGESGKACVTERVWWQFGFVGLFERLEESVLMLRYLAGFHTLLYNKTKAVVSRPPAHGMALSPRTRAAAPPRAHRVRSRPTHLALAPATVARIRQYNQVCARPCPGVSPCLGGWGCTCMLRHMGLYVHVFAWMDRTCRSAPYVCVGGGSALVRPRALRLGPGAV